MPNCSSLEFEQSANIGNLVPLINPANVGCGASFIYFYDAASAGGSMIINKGGLTENEIYSSITDFFDNSTSGNANIINEAALSFRLGSGVTRFIRVPALALPPLPTCPRQDLHLGWLAKPPSRTNRALVVPPSTTSCHNFECKNLPEDLGTTALPPGTVITVMSNTAATPISGRFNNLADDQTITADSNTFQAITKAATGMTSSGRW